MNGPNKRKTGAVASFAYTVVQIIVNLLYVPLLLRGMSQEEYGLYQMIGSVIAYLNIINSTLSAGATRYYSKYYVLGDKVGMANTLGLLKRVYRKAIVLVMLLAVILMGALRIVYEHSFTEWEITESCLLVAVLAVNLAVTMGNTLSVAVITSHEEFPFLKLSLLVSILIQPVVVLVIIGFFPYALSVSLVQLVLNIVCSAVQHGYAKKRLGMDTRLRFYDRGLERGLLSFSGAIVLALVADQIFWKTDQLILGYYFGTSVVAVYAVGAQVVNAYMPLGTAVSSVFLPRVSDLWYKAHDVRAISELFVKVSRIALYPCLAVLMGFVVFGRDFVRLWAGEGYDEAYWVAVVVLIPFTVDVVQNIGLTILQVMNRYAFRAKMYIVAALINIALTFLLVGRFGCVGAAVSSGVGIAVSSGFVLNWYYAKHVGLAMSAWWRSIAREAAPLVAVGLASGFMWSQLSVRPGWMQLIAGIAVYAVAFAVAAYFLSANAYEKQLVKAILRRLGQRVA